MNLRQFVEADLYADIKVSKLKDGRYRGRVRIGKNPVTDNYEYKSFYGNTPIDVKAQIHDFIRAQIDGQTAQREIDALLSTDLESWLYHEKYGTVKAGSFDRLEQIYKYQIVPHIAGLQTVKASARDCKRIMDANLECGYSYSTLLKIYRLLNEYFETRRKGGELNKNPMDTLKMYSRDFVLQRQSALRDNREEAKSKKDAGKKLNEAEETLAASKLRMEDREEIRILTDEEIARLRDVAYNGYFLEFTSRGGKPVRSGPYPLKQAKFFIFAMNVGLRKGELMALKYSDVDFDKKCITIKSNRTVAKKREAGGKATGGVNAVESSPKTKRSMAVIPVSELALEILRDMLAEEADGYNGYIANDGGKPLVESAFRRRFNSLLKQAHVEHCGLHTLRHTFASKLFAATNGNAKLVSELVRHSSVSFTEDIYIHLIEQTKANVLEDFSI